jgi:hypothetical protein
LALSARILLLINRYSPYLALLKMRLFALVGIAMPFASFARLVSAAKSIVTLDVKPWGKSSCH